MSRTAIQLSVAICACILFSAFTCIDYRILKEGCTDGDKCLAIAVVNPKHFNRADMERLGRLLSEKYKSKVAMTVLLFDDAMVAQAFADGKREFRDHELVGRGKYIRSEAKEFISYPPKKGNPFNSVTINLR